MGMSREIEGDKGRQIRGDGRALSVGCPCPWGPRYHTVRSLEHYYHRTIITETLPHWSGVEIRARHNFVLEVGVAEKEVWPSGFDPS